MEDYKAWYEEAMVASNEAGFVGLSAAETIRALATQGRCKTCKAWEPYNDSDPGLRDAGVCTKARQIWDVTEDDAIDDEWSEWKKLKPEHAGLLAVVEDGSQYSAQLITMSNFGCVQHEEKGEESVP